MCVSVVFFFRSVDFPRCRYEKHEINFAALAIHMSVLCEYTDRMKIRNLFLTYIPLTYIYAKKVTSIRFFFHSSKQQNLIRIYIIMGGVCFYVVSDMIKSTRIFL